MNPLTISFNTKTVAGYRPAVSSDPQINTAADNGKPDTHQAAIKPLNYPGRFASALAHEVRNPLATINLSIEMLASTIKDNDMKMYLDIIMRSSARINSLINEFLKYEQTGEAQAEKYSIHRLLDDALEMAQDRILLKKITVKKKYAARDCKIALNRPKMKIALTNIIINAIDAMTSGKGELKLVTKSIDGRYIVQIEDNGCGISKENLKYIFKPYFTNKPGGLGLGLATTYDILQSDHVEVNVESVEGEGTRFILLFNKSRPQIAFTATKQLKM